MSDARNQAAVKVAVVGHTNSGKTSLLRTLLRDGDFGEVSDSAGTTRHVEGAAILLDGDPVIALYDTPGLEDSIGLLGAMDDWSAAQGQAENNGHQRLVAFVSHGEQFAEFDQELKVLRQLLVDELVFYVIDVREPVLGKYRDEMTLLSYAAKPVIPVLNFIASSRSRADEWRSVLAEFNMHAQVDFDTVVFRFDDELRLLRKMQSLLPAQHDILEQLMDHRQQQWQSDLDSAARRCAELLVDCAAYYHYSPPDEAALASAQQQMQQRLRKADKRAQRDVLAIFGFDTDDVRLSALSVSDGVWQADLFDKTLLKTLGIDISSGAARGAALGASLDVFTGGLSLGTATAVGAIAGAAWSTRERVGRRLGALLNREQRVCADDVTLSVLWRRQIALLSTLQSRGHAATRSTELAAKTVSAQMPENWSRWLRRIRANPDWSRLNKEGIESPLARDEQLALLGNAILASCVVEKNSVNIS